jgi:hypothetical protein
MIFSTFAGLKNSENNYERVNSLVAKNGYTIDSKIKVLFMSLNNTKNLTFEDTDDFQKYVITNNAQDIVKAIDDVAVAVHKPLYPTDIRNELFPVNNYIPMIKNRNIVVSDIEFYATWKTSKGGAGLTAEQINAAFISSLDNVNSGVNQGAFDYVSLPTGQPNWFRPKLLVNGLSLLANLDATNVYDTMKTNHSAQFGIGLPLPYSENIERIIVDFSELHLYAQSYIPIKIEENYIFQRLPIFAVMNLYLLR